MLRTYVYERTYVLLKYDPRLKYPLCYDPLDRSNFQVDLTNLKASEEVKRNIEKLFRDYSNVFSKSD